jgi:hypothetical protein
MPRPVITTRLRPLPSAFTALARVAPIAPRRLRECELSYQTRRLP